MAKCLDENGLIVHFVECNNTYYNISHKLKFKTQTMLKLCINYHFGVHLFFNTNFICLFSFGTHFALYKSVSLLSKKRPMKNVKGGEYDYPTSTTITYYLGEFKQVSNDVLFSTLRQFF